MTFGGPSEALIMTGIMREQKNLSDRIEVDKYDREFIKKGLEGIDKVVKIPDLNFDLFAEKFESGGGGVRILPKNWEDKIRYIQIYGADVVYYGLDSEYKIYFIYTHRNKKHNIEIYTKKVGGPED